MWGTQEQWEKRGLCTSSVEERISVGGAVQREAPSAEVLLLLKGTGAWSLVSLCFVFLNLITTSLQFFFFLRDAAVPLPGLLH